MYKNIKYILTTIFIASMIVACTAEATPTPAQDSDIQTAVALTVAAQNAQPIVVDTPTPAGMPTPLQFIPTLTPLASAASPTPALNTTASECASASLVSETIPDQTIFKPGQVFTKTWQIKNTSNCTWDTNYKIVFWDGNVLGGSSSYNLPQVTPPQGVVPISLILTAPTADAAYTSKWVLQTPDGVNFGVGQYSAPFYTQIVVSASTSPGYTITSVTYSVERDPPTGCPANVNHIVSATITTNGPLEFSYIWLQQDGNSASNNGGDGKGVIKMTAAGTKTITREWKLHLGSAPGSQRWIALAVTLPNEEYVEYLPGQYFTYLCGS